MEVPLWAHQLVATRFRIGSRPHHWSLRYPHSSAPLVLVLSLLSANLVWNAEWFDDHRCPQSSALGNMVSVYQSEPLPWCDVS